MDLKFKMNLIKQIFTWWNRQTVGTFLKTVFLGKLVGKDQYGNKYYQSKKDERWVIYAKEVEATKITDEWFLWIHHTTNQTPNNSKNKYNWQKDHIENLSGTENAYKPNTIKKNLEHKKYDNWKN